MADITYITAHESSIGNRAAIEKSRECGCFFCEEIFPAANVKEWAEERDGLPSTALCPNCRIDTVLPDATGIVLTEDLLRQMKDYWFGSGKSPAQQEGL